MTEKELIRQNISGFKIPRKLKKKMVKLLRKFASQNPIHLLEYVNITRHILDPKFKRKTTEQ